MNTNNENNENNEKNISFSIKGMTCASCVRIVERSLKKVDGVQYASVNLATEKAYIIADEKVDTDDLKATVAQSGYEPTEEKISEDIILERFKQARRSMFIALLITIPLMVVMLFHMAGIHVPAFYLIETLAGLLVIIFAGGKTFKSAVIALKHRHTNMDSLVSLGAFFAWITAPLAAAGLDIVSFGSLSPMLISLHLAGRYIESRLKHQASGEIRQLLNAQPDQVSLIKENETLEVPVESVKKDDLLLIRTGERIPLDGIIANGSAAIDESMVTGEPVPVFKEKDSELISGSLITAGTVTMKVTRTGADTFLSKMVRLIEEAQSSRVPIQAFADRITNYFIPAVLLLALTSGIIWYFNYDSMQGFLTWSSSIIPWVNADAGAFATALSAFIATLVIACPCALGLATPMALMAGTGAAAARGLIIRNGEAVQKVPMIEVLIFDKTGTITEGKPAVQQTNLDSRTIAAIANLEKASTHPLAHAIIQYSEKLQVHFNGTFEDIEETPGTGVAGYINGDLYSAWKPENIEQYAELTLQGYTIIEIKKNNSILGYFAISDTIKKDVIATLKKLHDKGITTVMATGDNENAAQKVASICGIDHVHAGISPSEKIDIVNHYKKQNLTVAMAGDGINDAAALKTADVSYAMGNGTDIAIDNADIIITKGDLTALADSFTVSQITYSKIKQNLFWAFLYNVIAIPLAMAALLHPLIAEGAMTLSSINVIINSMNIKKKVLQNIAKEAEE